MASTWALGWSSTCNEVIYPGELPVGLSTLLSRCPHSLSAAHWRSGVEPPRMCSPFQSHVGPQRRVQRAIKYFSFPGELPWGSPHSSHEAPIHFRPYCTARFRVLSTCTCWAQGCCCKRWRVRPSWRAGDAQHAVMLLPDPCHAVRGRLSSPTSK
jgi:hypothetical protein